LENGNKVLIACSMLRDETEQALAQTKTDIQIIWIDKGLHEYPQRLHNELQAKINENQYAKTILLAFCLCGNAVLGLRSEKATLIIPRFDDCIHMLMAREPEKKPEIDAASLYYTRGWLESERFILNDCQAYQKKYGPKKADFIIKTMLANYKGLKLIDTGAYDVAGCEERAKDAAQRLGLAFESVQGTGRILRNLFAGKYADEFVIVTPGETVESRHFGY
jgi:hypothetical protein